MQPDVLSYHHFYKSPLGTAVSDIVAAQIARFWPSMDQAPVAGLGYAVPYLDHMEKGGATGFALMPARQGVVHWPSLSMNRTALVDPHMLPFPDSDLDRLLLVHALEHSERPDHMLREIWRVLAPSGEVIIIVPNRRRVWSAIETTPFGHGRPFSKGQLTGMMTDQMLAPTDSLTVLMTPPFKTRFGAKILRMTEKPLRMVGSGFLGGILMVRARKQMYGLLSRKTQPVRRPAPLPAFQNVQTLVSPPVGGTKRPTDSLACAGEAEEGLGAQPK